MTHSTTDHGRTLPRNLSLSPQAADQLKRLEGLRLRAYGDVGGKRTIGYGHLMQPGEPTTITKAQADAIFTTDVRRHEKALRTLAPVPLRQSEYDALVLFIFNVGTDAFRKSTMRKHLLALNYAQAAHEFGRWVYVNGRVVPGLKKRRDVERKLFNTIPF